MDLSEVNNHNEVNSDTDALSTPHSLAVNMASMGTTQSVPNLNERPRNQIRLPPIEHIRGRTNVI
jgi:hypothetical protein